MKKVVTDNVVEIFGRTMSGASWMIVHRPLLHILDSNEVILFAHLANVAEMNRAKQSNKGWFTCAWKRTYQEIGFNRNKQTGLFKKLKARRFIRTFQSGMPSKRWIQIQWDEVLKALANVQIEVGEN